MAANQPSPRKVRALKTLSSKRLCSEFIQVCSSSLGTVKTITVPDTRKSAYNRMAGVFSLKILLIRLKDKFFASCFLLTELLYLLINKIHYEP